jgi:SAM-dependent methyltransferase
MNFKQLFSRRTPPVDARPDSRGMSPYSFEIVQLLESRYALAPGAIGAEIGAGKGRLAELFLKHGYPLLATEDDATDRAVCERLKERFPGLRVASGTPTATNLPGASVDFILSERALFEPDQEAVQREFRRILRPGGPILIITDNRVYAGGRQTEEYTDILRRYCPNFKEKLLPYDIPSAVAKFFAGVEVYEDAFVGTHVLSLEFLLAQTRALEIYPASGDPARRKLDAEMTAFFQRWQINGKLHEPVVCRVACGRFDAPPPAPEAVEETATARDAALVVG